MKEVVVIGGGASGLMAAYAAAESGNRVTLVEKNEKLGKKIYITGKGRCNLTNDCPPDEFLQNVVRGGKFLTGAIYAFPPARTMQFMEENGLALKVERGNRVFPASDHASDVTKTLERACTRLGVRILLNTEVKSILPLSRAAETDNLPPPASDTNNLPPSASYSLGAPLRESRYEVTQSLGTPLRGSCHEVTEGVLAEKGGPPSSFDHLPPAASEPDSLSPPALEINSLPPAASEPDSLSPPAESSDHLPPPCVKGEGREGDPPSFLLRTSRADLTADAVILATGGLAYPSTGSTGDGYRFAAEAGHTVTPCVPSLVGLELKTAYAQGVTLKNVVLTARRGEKVLSSRRGELLFTHYGISGPLVLTLSAEINRLPLSEIALTLDFKPALGERMLDARLLRDFSERKNEQMKNVMRGLLPAALTMPVLQAANISPAKQANAVTREERARLISALKAFPLVPTKLRGYEEAVVTSGGVSLSEVNPKSMESKKVKGLYFCGEVLDVDAYTGGFNLQIAFATGYCAGKNIK